MATRQVAYSVIPRFREQWDLSQQDLAVELGVSVSTITRWEAAGHAPLWFARWMRGYELDRTTGDRSLTTLDKLEVPTPAPRPGERFSALVERVSTDPAPLTPFNLKPYGG